MGFTLFLEDILHDKEMSPESRKFWQSDVPAKILVEGFPFVVGRAGEDQVNLTIDSAWRRKIVSRVHAKFVRHGDSDYAIEDNESTNGIMVNFRRVRSKVLEDGDIVTFGGAGLVLEGALVSKPWARTDLHYRLSLDNSRAPAPLGSRGAVALASLAAMASSAADAAADPTSKHTSDGGPVSKRQKTDSGGGARAHKQVYALHTKVEGKSRNEATGEVNAWFPAHIRAFNAKKGLYELQWFDDATKNSHDPELNEWLPVHRVRLDTGTANWKFKELREGQLVEVTDTATDWWYDALIVSKLDDPAVVGDNAPCVTVRFMDHPRISGQKVFDVPATRLYVPAKLLTEKDV